jgi:hypothetical protein
MDGADPLAGLTRDAAGNLYGTTQGNGVINAASTVFKVDPKGHETVLYDFQGLSDPPTPCLRRSEASASRRQVAAPNEVMRLASCQQPAPSCHAPLTLPRKIEHIRNNARSK